MLEALICSIFHGMQDLFLFLSYIFILFGSQGISFNIAFIGKKNKGKFVLG